jgi:hypothetical protein
MTDAGLRTTMDKLSGSLRDLSAELRTRTLKRSLMGEWKWHQVTEAADSLTMEGLV